jgi:signal transduction histidine kinase/ligand-binding sensor domain-containing protein
MFSVNAVARSDRLKLLLCVFSLISSSAALAVDPTEQLSELNHTQWTAREGCPPVIDSIVQASNGLLWLASEVGLFQFDGVHFQRLTLADGTQPVTGSVKTVAALGDDLWIGMRLGGAYLLHEGKLTHYGVTDGLPARSVIQFVARLDGIVWAQTTAGLYFLRDGRWQNASDDWGYPVSTGAALFLDKAGTLWARSPQGTYYLEKDAHSFIKTPHPGGRGMAIEDPDGFGYVGGDNGLEPISGSGITITGADLGGATAEVGGTGFDSDGGLWSTIELKGGIVRLVRFPHAVTSIRRGATLRPEDGQILKPAQALSGEPDFAYEDKEHNFWVATTGGLDEFRSNKLHSAVETLSLVLPAMSVSQDGNIWLATPYETANFRSAQAPPIIVRSTDVPAFDQVTAMLAEPDGSLLVGQEEGHFGRIKDHRYSSIAVPSSSRSLAINGIARDAAGALWIASTGVGLYRQQGADWQINGGFSVLPSSVPLSLSSDDGKQLWIGYPDDQLFLVDAAMQLHRFDSSAGLLVGAVLAITVKNQRVWVGGTEGVAYLDKQRFVALRNTKGIPFTNVSGIVEDSIGGLWLNGGDGVTHISASEVNSFIKDRNHLLSNEILNSDDGLRQSAPLLRPLPTAFESGDGRLWFLTSAGAYWIDPAHIPTNALAPAVLVQSIIVNGQSFIPDKKSIALPPRTTAFEIDYTATSLSIPSRVRFRYKLDGLDHEWQDAGNRRQAFYTNVPPGIHRFRVIAANEDGVWNQAGVVTEFYIAPAFYQTSMFILACAAALVGLIWAGVHLRLRVVAATIRERAEVRADERVRIARDLHDTLLQGVQGLTLHFHVAAQELPKGSRTRESMEHALVTADRILVEGRDRVTRLRADHLSPLNLRETLEAVASSFNHEQRVRFALSVEGPVDNVVLPVLHELHYMGREAITNAFRHSSASEITVSLKCGRKSIIFVIADNGRGFEPAAATNQRTGHWGLSGIKERAEALGGQFECRSTENKGTEILISVPSRRAYKKGIAG